MPAPVPVPDSGPSPRPGTFAYLYAQLPDGDEHAKDRGDAFERIVRWLLANDPVLALDVVNVWRWEQWDDRFHMDDIGIDFVVELTDGRLVAVQAKAWTDRPTYRDLGTFWAASTVPDRLRSYRFSRRLLVCPPGVSERIPPAIFHAIPDTTVWDATALEQLGLTWPTSLNELPELKQEQDVETAPAARHELRSHQRAAVDALTVRLAETDRVQLVMACGTGKTLVCQRTAERLTATTDGLVVVAAPSLALLAQLRREWARDADRPLDMLPVGSEDDLLREVHEARTTAHTTDPGEVAGWLQRDRDGRQPVVFATYHSLERVHAALERTGMRASVLICDEAHRLAGRPDARFASATNAEFPTDRRVFTTATPRVFTTAGQSGGDGTVVSMDDETTFGTVAFRYGFNQAVADGRLVDYQLAVLDVDTAAVATAIDRRALAEVAGMKVTTELLAQVTGTVKAIVQHGLRRVVVFHHRVRDVRAHAALLVPVAEALGVDTSGWWTDSVVGTTAPAEREARLARLRDLPDGEVGIITTARVLSEGVDVPALDAVVFADPRTSQVDVVQAVGRVMRTAPGKELGYVIVPIPIDRDDPMAALADGRFAPVVQTLTALGDHDPMLRVRLNEIRRALGRRGGVLVGGLEARTGGRASMQFDTMSGAELTNFLEAIGLHLVDRITLSFEFWFGRLEAFVAVNGTADVPRHPMCADDQPLADQVAAWRSAAKRGNLAESHRRRLEALEGWSWGTRTYPTVSAPKVQRSASEYETLARDWLTSTGNSRVPRVLDLPYVYGRTARVGEWFAQRRYDRRRGRLREATAEILDTHLPGWDL